MHDRKIKKGRVALCKAVLHENGDKKEIPAFHLFVVFVIIIIIIFIVILIILLLYYYC